MIDHLRAMAVFSKVVETGSFRAAADALDMTPSAVSQHVSKLEAHLDCALLYRTTRRLSLTDEGTKLYASSAEMVRTAEEGLSALVERSEQPAGRLRAALPATVFETPRCLDGLAAFARRYPRVALSASYSDQMLDLLGSAFDVAVRVGWLEDSRYKARRLCEIERTLVAAPDYLGDRPPPTTLAALSALHWIKLVQFTPAKQMTTPSGEVPDFAPPIAIEVDDLAAAHGLALRGLGVAVLPTIVVAPSIDSGALVVLDVGWPLMAPGVYAVWPGNASESGIAARFVTHLAEWFESEEGRLSPSARLEERTP